MIVEDEDEKGVRVRYFVCVNDDPMPCACGQESTKLCDGAAAPGKTCDDPICDRCATTIGETRGDSATLTLARTFHRQSKMAVGRTIEEQRAWKATKIRHRDALRAVADEGDTIDLCRACVSARDLKALLAKGATIP